MKLTLRELRPKMWPDLERLFQPNGACGGCWCMHWRREKGTNWEKAKGASNRRALRKLVESGRAHGALAYADGVPVGWVSFEKRRELAKLDRAPSLVCDDADRVWSIPCFFIARGFRKKGVGSKLLEFAVKTLKAKRAECIEGYPTNPKKEGEIPAAFAWTGTLPMFEKAGFKPVGPRDGGKQRVRIVRS